MNILILGDVFGPPGMKAITQKLPSLIKKKEVDFVIINGENSGDSGVGITKKNTEELFNAGADVITSGNHVWDEKETVKFIDSEERLLRPENLAKESPVITAKHINKKFEHNIDLSTEMSNFNSSLRQHYNNYDQPKLIEKHILDNSIKKKNK